VSDRDYTQLRLDGYVACNGCGAVATYLYGWSGGDFGGGSTLDGGRLATCSDCKVTEPGWVEIPRWYAPPNTVVLNP
jgi:hypothetical protein